MKIDESHECFSDEEKLRWEIEKLKTETAILSKSAFFQPAIWVAIASLLISLVGNLLQYSKADVQRQLAEIQTEKLTMQIQLLKQRRTEIEKEAARARNALETLLKNRDKQAGILANLENDIEKSKSTRKELITQINKLRKNYLEDTTRALYGFLMDALLNDNKIYPNQIKELLEDAEKYGTSVDDTATPSISLSPPHLVPKLFAATLMEATRRRSMKENKLLLEFIAIYGRNISIKSILKDLFPKADNKTLDYMVKNFITIIQTSFDVTSFSFANWRESVLEELKKNDNMKGEIPRYRDLLLDTTLFLSKNIPTPSEKKN